MNRIKIAFLGTPQIAVPFLDFLNKKNDQYEIIAVFSAPDKKQGRSMKIHSTPVTQYATDHNLPIYRPTTKQQLADDFNTIHCDVALVVAYGMLIPESTLTQFSCGFINVHFSLLPQYRGASPIQAALLAGEQQTGVTLFKLVKNMDSGPIIAKKTITIDQRDTSESLADTLVQTGVDIMSTVIPDYVTGKIKMVKQDESHASYCTKISKADGKIDFHNDTAEMVMRKMKAYSPWPGVYAHLDGKILKCIELESIGGSMQPGSISIHNKTVSIGTQKGVLAIKKIQLEGKPVMTAEAFAAGYKKYDGQLLQ